MCIMKRIKVLEMIAEDARNDAIDFDGRPFNGTTVAEYFGNHGAAIESLANIMKSIVEETMTRYEIKTDRRGKDRRKHKLWPTIKFWCLTLKKQERRYNRRIPQFLAVNQETGHYIVYR